MEHIFKPGDPCGDCQQLGLKNHLRYFHINLKEKILKCESNKCLFPYEDDMEYVDQDFVEDLQTQFVDTEEQILLSELPCLMNGDIDAINDELQEATQIKTDINQLQSDCTQLQTDALTPVTTNCTELESNHSARLKSDSANAAVSPEQKSENFTITQIQTGSWVQYANVLNDGPASAKEDGDNLVSSVAKESEASSSHAEDGGASNTSSEIPKARIKRFFDAIKTYENVSPSRKRKGKKSTERPDGTSGRQRKTTTLIKTSTNSSNKNPFVKPLDLLQDIFKDRP